MRLGKAGEAHLGDPLATQARRYVDLATSHHDKKQFDVAVEYWLSALNLAPEAGVIWYHMGRDLKCLHRLDEAKDAFLNAVKYRPSPESLTALAWQFVREQNYAEAARYLHHALVLNSQYAEAHYYLSICQFAREEYAEAWRSLKRALRLGHEDKAGILDSLRATDPRGEALSEE